MPVSLGCACGAHYEIKDEFTGRQLRCQKCGAVLTAPGQSQSGAGPVSDPVFGLLGASIVFFKRFGHHFHIRDKRVGVVLVIWAAYSFVTGLALPMIDNAAHLRGLIGGAALACSLRPEVLDR